MNRFQGTAALVCCTLMQESSPVNLPLSFFTSRSISLCPCSSSSEHASQWEWIRQHGQRSRRWCGGGNLLHPASVSTWPHLRPKPSSPARSLPTLGSSVLLLWCISASVLAAVHVFPPPASTDLLKLPFSFWVHIGFKQKVHRNSETVENLRSVSFLMVYPICPVSLHSKWTFCKICYLFI